MKSTGCLWSDTTYSYSCLRCRNPYRRSRRCCHLCRPASATYRWTSRPYTSITWQSCWTNENSRRCRSPRRTRTRWLIRSKTSPSTSTRCGWRSTWTIWKRTRTEDRRRTESSLVRPLHRCSVTASTYPDRLTAGWSYRACPTPTPFIRTCSRRCSTTRSFCRSAWWCMAPSRTPITLSKKIYGTPTRTKRNSRGSVRRWIPHSTKKNRITIPER